MISKQTLAGLKNVKSIKMSVKEILSIGNVAKPVLGAVLIEIEVDGNTLALKCLIIDTMKYSIVLGRDMLDYLMIGMDHTQNTIYFKKDVPTEDLAADPTGLTNCFLTKDVLL